MILPTRDRELASGLLEDFEAHGRFALVPVSIYLLLWMPMNYRMGVPWLSLENGLDVVLGILAAVAFISKDQLARAGASLLYLAVAAWGVFSIWARPGIE